MDKSRGLKPCGRGVNKLFSPCSLLPAPLPLLVTANLKNRRFMSLSSDYINFLYNLGGFGGV